MFADNHVMCDVNQVIDDNPVPDLCIAQGTSVYGSTRANLNIVSNA